MRILEDMVREGADRADDVENVQLALLSSDPAATVIGIYTNKTSTIQMAAAGAFALEAGVVVEAVHQIEIANVFSTPAGIFGFVGTMFLMVASGLGICWFGWGAFRQYWIARAVLKAVERLK
jgi:hypothetical protein